MKMTEWTTRWVGGALAATIFAAAFLLFGVQPLLGRYILPWFGGMPEVWTACMLFFQVFLLAGYAYAHLLSRLGLRWQAAIHIVLTGVAAATLAIVPDAALKPEPDDAPVVKILWICAVCVGAAYFVLSATSPLVQSWFARVLPGRNPYRLYALSNAGSLLALASFPFVFEPLMTRDATATLWEWGFLGYAGLVAICGVILFCTKTEVRSQESEVRSQKTEGRDAAGRDRFFWLALPMAASVLLLAVTNKITLDIAVIPFLWVLPLGLYLLSFILCFEHPRWYHRGVSMTLLVAAMLGHVWVGRKSDELGAGVIIAVYALLLFSGCMVCHGEAYRLRPAARQLTGFYLMIALGGAAGGVFVAVLAPRIFTLYHELHLGLLGIVLLALLCRTDVPAAMARRRPYWAAALCAAGAAGVFLQAQRVSPNETVLENARNFFGVLTVVEETPADTALHKRLMQHGTTYHGLQFLDADKRRLPTAYYSPDSGIGLVLRDRAEGGLRIGVVGLGVGTIAAYGLPGDTIRFYEINPEVERLARKYFTYLADSAAAIDVVLGDARLSMEYQEPQGYDVLALDAFSSDAVPVHLLTVEAFEIYLRHLKPDGVLAVHISTRHLDLQSVIWKLAEHFGLHSRWIESYEQSRTGALSSDWILLSRSESPLKTPAIAARCSSPYADLARVPLWTDDHINLLKVLKKR